jgi:C_GCAxxG_C_C family probable redox protein
MNDLTREEFLSFLAIVTGSLFLPGTLTAEDFLNAGLTEKSGEALDDELASVDIVEYARQQFDNGSNCAEAVLFSVSKSKNLDCGCMQHIAAGLGGGMGVGEACGALSGGVLAIGLLYGDDPSDDMIVNKKTKAFTKNFEKRNGGLRCADIKQGRKNCRKMVGNAVRFIDNQ